jgi:ribonuclease G
MVKQIVIHCDNKSAKVALQEDGHLSEYYVERPSDRQLVGNIYKDG